MIIMCFTVSVSAVKCVAITVEIKCILAVFNVFLTDYVNVSTLKNETVKKEISEINRE